MSHSRGSSCHLEGNHYSPPESLRREYLTDSKTKSLCLWKGLASYHTVTVRGEVNRDAGWYYPHPSPLARRIRNHVAFGNGVGIEGGQVQFYWRPGCPFCSRLRGSLQRVGLPVREIRTALSGQRYRAAQRVGHADRLY